MDSSPLLKVLFAFVLVFLNGFFVASEFALIKVRKTRLQEMAEGGSFLARIAQKESDHLDSYLSAAQVGITLASLALGWIGEPAFAGLVESLFKRLGVMSADATHGASWAISFLAFALITFLHIVFGEQAPKIYAILKAEKTALVIAWPLNVFFRIFYPAIWLLNWSANVVLRSIGLNPSSGHSNVHTEEEIRMILAESARGGSLKDSEALLVEQAFEFADTPVHAVMVPRVDVDYLSLEWTNDRILEQLNKKPHTRYLIVEDEDQDKVRGFVHLKELVSQLASGGIDLPKILRPLHIVPETRSIERLMRELQTRHSQIALVLDEYGGTAGIVTMEDLVEELIGEITDELDEEPPEIERQEDHYKIQGAAALSDLSRELKEEIESEDFDTLGGWIMGTLERVPNEGDTVESERYVFTVARMEGPRIVEVLAVPKSPPVTDEDKKSGRHSHMDQSEDVGPASN